VPEWLPRSATFIHTALRHQQRRRPVVLADRVTNAEEFPIEPLVELLPDSVPRARRVAARVRAYAGGVRTTYDARVISAVREHDCGLLHAHFGPMGCAMLEARAKLGIPLVTTYYGYDLAFAKERPEWQPRYERLFREGTLFVCEGPAMAAHLASLGCPPERIRVVKIGIELDRFPFRPAPPAGPLVFIATGRFVPKKGFDIAIRAFAAAVPAIGDAELWLVGDGPERPALERIVRELDIQKRVRFLGMLTFDDYTRAMQQAHVGVQPSRTAPNGDTEGGAPTVIIEMQAAGMPVLATRHADIPAVVARPGDLVAEGDADGLAAAMMQIARLGPDQWLERVREARALVEAEHAAPRTAAALEQVYDEAAAVTEFGIGSHPPGINRISD
jgi:glycosyltransferase involved in cell wall biosynthesis